MILFGYSNHNKQYLQYWQYLLDLRHFWAQKLFKVQKKNLNER